MRGSPRSIMLTWANRAAGVWTSAAAAAVKRQQRAFLSAALGSLKPKPPRRRARKRNP